jgi:hypothetical protein
MLGFDRQNAQVKLLGLALFAGPLKARCDGKHAANAGSLIVRV